jgi:hypothetical protein
MDTSRSAGLNVMIVVAESLTSSRKFVSVKNGWFDPGDQV